MFVLVCSGEVNRHSVSRIRSWAWPPWLLGPDPFLAAISNLASPIANMVMGCSMVVRIGMRITGHWWREMLVLASPEQQGC